MAKSLKIETMVRAHSGYSKFLDGMQLAQTGLEEVVMSRFFEADPEENDKVKHMIKFITAQCKDIAAGKGLILKVIQNMDALITKQMESHDGQTQEPDSPSW